MRLQTFSNLILKGSLRVPLRVALIVPFIFQLSVAVGLTAYFSLRNGQKAVNEVAAQLRSEVTARIHQHISDYMETPQLVTQINADSARSGNLNLQNSLRLERHFWRQMQLFKSLSPIAFGSEQGEIHSVDRLDDGSLVIRVIDQSTSSNYHTYTTDSQGNRGRLVQVNTTFDPRTRPWYIKAVKGNKPTWTEIYPYFSSSGLAISATRPFYNDAGTLLGVTNATLSLSELGDFLDGLKIGRTGQMFIVERSGNLVASSTAEQPFILHQEEGKQKRERLAAIASRNLVTRLTAQYLKERFGNFNNIRHSQQLDFEIEGKQQFAQVTPFTDSYGLEWVIVVVVPEADFMEHIEANTRTTILLCLAALIFATVMGVLTSQYITRPIAHLISASQEIANGKLDQTVKVNGINELEVLAQAYNQMATQLQTSFTALEKANEELELRVEQRTAELQERTLQLKQSLDFEATLKRITDRVRDNLDEAQILQNVVQELASVLAAECCAAALYDIEQKTLVINYEYAQLHWPSTQGSRIELEELSGIHQSLLQGQCLQFCQLAPKFGRPHAAILACPVFDDQGILADIWLFQRPNYNYSELEIRLLQQVANQCAIAIRQARLYQAAQAQVEELKSLHQLKDDFLSTVSHELRTPISNIKLAIRMLKLAPTPERHKQYLDILEAECAREANLINDLLDLQRLEANRYPVFVESIILQDYIPSIIKPFLSRIQERQQVFNIDLQPDILPIMSSPDSLGRLLAELLNNACKYTPSNGEIRFNIKQDIDLYNPQHTASTTSFEVSNQAEIPTTEIPHIFDKFYRVPNADPWKQGGTGLGLALVKKLVEQLGGEIRVESGEGWTSFTILLENIEVINDS
ncbi:ATP-binding protein [Funiculus sociatus GB2-A5]|uniref:histidine kinase n=1 Tax=Funiculus sociatus GB2-A5 TaxID=2933946 RepID=A0ABV0JLL6_9CYAN|nr:MULTISPECIES: ATP-binding protein [unclassified Trichocoleus]MBD1905744.1 HAMP domain-containing protein [Trichocoleus sp. FACHB-832]MBD2065885.1 HAMP domain-containing protein [Trichocoleus sp. FACHB-6]